MSYEILATPNSIARGRYSIGEKENNLFLKLMYAIQRDNKEYIIAENRKTELSEDDILKWKSLCEIETLICKLTPEDFNEIFKRKNDRTENSLKETFSALSNCSITFDTVTRDGVRAKMIASLISHFYIEKETGNYQVVVPAKLYKYLFDLGLGHTQNALQVIYRLKGIYAQRFYIILRSWTGAKRDIEFSVQELRDMLQLGDKNKTFNSFETNILKRSIDEINSTGIMEIKIKEKIKKGRSVDEICCNRGTSGIEGSLSTAVGYAAASDKLNFIAIGDLSFFYDMNALWNVNVRPNLRILLLNNGGGEIFHTLRGLDMSGTSHKFIAAVHKTSAKGWAEKRGFLYLQAENEVELAETMQNASPNRKKRNVLCCWKCLPTKTKMPAC